MNVLIGCEESGVVREAFRALGHRAFSCDLAPARDGSAFHLAMDVRQAIRLGVPQWIGEAGTLIHRPNYIEYWDLLIAHPPCTYLCNSGVRWFTTIPQIQKPGTAYGGLRVGRMNDAAELFADLLTCGIPKIAIENPVMHKYAKAAIAMALQERGQTYEQAIRAATFQQSIQPWQFGHGEVKRTCLWLRGLPALVPTQIVEGRHPAVHRASPGPTRARDRSVTYQGIAAAMAAQWGGS